MRARRKALLVSCAPLLIFLCSCAMTPKDLPAEARSVQKRLTEEAIEVYGKGASVQVILEDSLWSISLKTPGDLPSAPPEDQIVSLQDQISTEQDRLNQAQDAQERVAEKAVQVYGKGASVQVNPEYSGWSIALKIPDKPKPPPPENPRAQLLDLILTELAGLNRHVVRGAHLPKSDKVEEADVVLVAEKNIIADLVRLFTLSRYSHVAVATVVNDEPYVTEALGDRGVVTRDLRLYMDDPQVRVLVRRMHPGCERWFNADIRKAVVENAKRRFGLGYNWSLFVRIALSRLPFVGSQFMKSVPNNGEKYICSELVQVAYYEAVKGQNKAMVESVLFRRKYPPRKSPLPDLNWPPLHFMMPKDFAETEKLVTVGEKEKGGLWVPSLGHLHQASPPSQPFLHPSN